MRDKTFETLVPQPMDEIRFERELRAATTLEEFSQIEKPRGFPSRARNLWRENWIRIMRLQIAGIRTPMDVLVTHQYFVRHKSWDREIQQELGEKAREIIGGWVSPEAQASIGRPSMTI